MKYKDSVSLELETINNRLQTMKNGIQNRVYTQPVLIREITNVGGLTKRISNVITDSNDVYYKERIQQNLVLILNKMKVLLDAATNNSKDADSFVREVDSIIRLTEFVSDTVSLENREIL